MGFSCVLIYNWTMESISGLYDRVPSGDIVRVQPVKHTIDNNISIAFTIIFRVYCNIIGTDNL